MGRFDEYLTGKMEIEVGKEKLELDVRIKDKRKFKTIVGKDGISEEKLELIDNVIIDILTRSYPEESKESMEAFYFKNDVALLNALLVGFGWLKKEDLETTKSKN